LLRRYSETRRPHPLGKNYSVRESLSHERALMDPIRKLADVVIDTTQFNVHELRHFITTRFKNPDKSPMLVSVVSFGYRYGVPSDADLVFDVRFLPNPHFVPRLRPYTGKDPKVRRYIRSFPQTGEFCGASRPAYVFDPRTTLARKSYLTIAFGCTGESTVPSCSRKPWRIHEEAWLFGRSFTRHRNVRTAACRRLRIPPSPET
jgi:UPF0042 nucleotide-binding protein